MLTPQEIAARVPADAVLVGEGSELFADTIRAEAQHGLRFERSPPSTPGAGAVARFWHVTLPMLAPTTFFILTISIISGFQTDFSGIHPRADINATDLLFRQEKDSYHAAIGVSSYGERERLLIGLRGHYSRGSILMGDAALQEPGFVSLSQSEWGVSLVLSGRISFRSVANTAARAATPLTQLPGVKDSKKRTKSREEKK